MPGKVSPVNLAGPVVEADPDPNPWVGPRTVNGFLTIFGSRADGWPPMDRFGRGVRTAKGGSAMNEGYEVNAAGPGRRSAADRGFTLVELLIVIVLLGIIAAVTVFAVRGVSDKGKVNVCLMDRRMLETAVESYLVEFPVAGMPTEIDLVVHGLLRGESANWDLDSSGNVTAQPGGPNDCIL